MQPSLYEFTVPEYQDRVNDAFRRVMRAVSVSQFNAVSDELSVEAVTVNDWWIAHITGKGTFRFHGHLPNHALRDRARLIFVLSGSSVMHGNGNYFGRPGEICLSRWENFDVCSHMGVFNYLAIYMPAADLERIFGGDVPYYRKIPTFGGPGKVVGTILRSWIEEMLSKREPEFLQSISEDLLRLVVRAFANSPLLTQFPEANAARRVHRVVNYLQHRLSDPGMAPALAARECGISERQLFRDFASEGLKFSDVLRKLRLQEGAMRLIRDRHVRVADISLECGFDCPAHFARLFRQAYGEAPRDFRERYVENNALPVSVNA